MTAAWRKSSFSATETACLELARVGGRVAVRDSKNPVGPTLDFDPVGLDDFLAWVKRV